MYETYEALLESFNKIGYIECDGFSQKVYYPKNKYFSVLYKNLDPKQYNGAYIASIKTRLDKNNNEFYIMTPIVKLPSYDDLKEYFITFFNKIEKKYFRDFTYTLYNFYINFISSFEIPLSVYIYRILKSCNYDEKYNELYFSTFFKIKNSISNDIELKNILKTEISRLYNFTINSKYDEIVKYLYKIAFPIYDCRGYFNLSPNIDYADIYFYKQYINNFPESINTKAVKIYQNFEFDICNIPEMIILESNKCLNAKIKFIDKSQYIIKINIKPLDDKNIEKCTSNIISKNNDDFSKKYKYSIISDIIINIR